MWFPQTIGHEILDLSHGVTRCYVVFLRLLGVGCVYETSPAPKEGAGLVELLVLGFDAEIPASGVLVFVGVQELYVFLG